MTDLAQVGSLGLEEFADISQWSVNDPDLPIAIAMLGTESMLNHTQTTGEIPRYLMFSALKLSGAFFRQPLRQLGLTASEPISYDGW